MTFRLKEWIAKATETLKHLYLFASYSNKVLWGAPLTDSSSYNWTSGSKTIADIDKYCLLAARPYGAATWMLAYNPSGATTLRFFGGYVNTTPNQFSYAFTAAKNSNTLTFQKATNINIAGTTHTDIGIACIVGVLPKWGW